MSPARIIPFAFAALAATMTLAQDVKPPLGRLFLTPDGRAHLDRQRQLNIKEARTLEGSTMRLDGVVLRSTGKSTVWVNRQAQTEHAGDNGVSIAISPRQPGGATLTAGGESPASLKVGQTINRATRETSDGIAAGEIRVNRAPANR